MSRVDELIAQICKARKYTESFLENTSVEDWFRQPTEGVTHIAWQVGHLASTEYALAMRRMRGTQQGDSDLMPDTFRECFGKGSLPNSDPAFYPSPTEIRATFDAVHKQTIEELKTLPDEALDEITEPPHPMFSTKYETLQWCAMHEVTHAGQIALLRRLLGHTWLR